MGTGRVVNGARGERSAGARRVGPLVIVACVLVGLAIAAAVALLPHRASRPLPGTRLSAVRVWNAIASHCQLENGVSEPLPFPCGANVVTSVFRTPDATTRPLVALQSSGSHGHERACVVDESSLEAVLCRDTFVDWVAYEGDVVSLAFLTDDGRANEIAQRRLSDGAEAAQRLSFMQWFDRRDAQRVFVIDGARRFRIDFGTLTFVGEAPPLDITL